ncbi:MAG: hypothetical protein HY904_08765 [Deltaproteobacteria bacterium]|nr:hypothetical protein [Deltaproteobacteria bacterium]
MRRLAVGLGCLAAVVVLGGAALAGAPWRVVTGPGNVALLQDPRLRFPVPRPGDLPMIARGEATLTTLLREGERIWYFGAPLEGEPFGVPTEVFDLFADPPPAPGGRAALFGLIDELARTGLHMVPGEALPRGIVRIRSPEPLVTQNCSACHSGVVQGRLWAGVGNKFYNQRAIIDGARAMMRAVIPLLEARPDEAGRDLLARTRRQMTKLERYDALYSRGCRGLGPGMITAARIWQISSKMLWDPAQLTERSMAAEFACGATKPPPLNTLRFRNTLFWDGSVNSLWVAHWPMFDFFGFDQYDRWKQLVESRAIQAMDAFVVFGTPSPSWVSVMGTPVDRAQAARGYGVFHAAQSCASCHGTHDAAGMLRAFRSAVTPLAVVRTDPERALAASDALLERFTPYGWAWVPRLSGLAADYGPGYAASPLCSTFMNYPYLHTGAVANLDQLLRPEHARAPAFWLGDVVDKERVGFFTGALPPPPPPPPLGTAPAPPPRLERRVVPAGHALGHSGAAFGTTLGEEDRRALIEYVKTLRCPEETEAPLAAQP